MNPVVSIITPSFNRADIIHETAESIFRQTYPHWEWVITDDGSTDHSWELLQQYAARDQRVKIFQRNRGPKGACVCRNISVENCTGEYVLFLDTDDLLASFCLEQRVQEMQRNQTCDFIIFPMLMFKQKPDDLKLLWNIDSEQDDLERILIGDPVCQGTGTLWKKTSFVNVGMWSEDLMLWQDIELHLRSLLRDVKYVKRLDLQPDVFIRVSEISLSRTAYHSLPKLKSRLQVLEQTGSSIMRKGLLQQYRKGLRYMFTDLYVNAVNGNYVEAVNRMTELEKQWNLLNPKERNNFSMYALLRKLRVYKISLLQDYLLKRVQRTIADQHHQTLNKIFYNKPIKA